METEDDNIVLIVVENKKDDKKGKVVKKGTKGKIGKKGRKGKIGKKGKKKTNTFPQPKIIKTEGDYKECLNIDELLKTVETHGEHIDFTVPHIKEETLDQDYLEDDTDPDYVCNEEETLQDDDDDDDDDDDVKPLKEQRRYWSKKSQDPSNWYSYVNELRNNAEIGDHDVLLIKALVDIMKAAKPDAPPPDYYLIGEDASWVCTYCKHKSSTEMSAGRHYQEKHGPRYLKCFACGVDFRSTTNLYKHEKRCIAPDAHLVLKARAIAVGGKAKNRPFMPPKPTEAVKRKQFKCPECPATFVTKQSLTAHEHLHRGERPYQCELCPAAYTSQSALSRHTVLHTDEKHVCHVCSKEVKTSKALEVHMDTHLPQKKYGCPHQGCGKRFSQLMAMKLHFHRKHLGLPPPCECQICSKRFARMSLLKEHMRKEHGMLLMTRNMFFKKLPTLKDTQVEHAKVVLRSEANAYVQKIEADVTQNDLSNFKEINNIVSQEEHTFLTEDDNMITEEVQIEYTEEHMPEAEEDHTDVGETTVEKQSEQSKSLSLDEVLEACSGKILGEMGCKVLVVDENGDTVELKLENYTENYSVDVTEVKDEPEDPPEDAPTPEDLGP